MKLNERNSSLSMSRLGFSVLLKKFKTYSQNVCSVLSHSLSMYSSQTHCQKNTVQTSNYMCPQITRTKKKSKNHQKKTLLRNKIEFVKYREYVSKDNKPQTKLMNEFFGLLMELVSFILAGWILR